VPKTAQVELRCGRVYAPAKRRKGPGEAGRGLHSSTSHLILWPFLLLTLS